MTYYAIKYPYGVAISEVTGKPLAEVYSFESKSSREAWINEGGDYRSGDDYREEIKSSDSFVRWSKTHNKVVEFNK